MLPIDPRLVSAIRSSLSAASWLSAFDNPLTSHRLTLAWLTVITTLAARSTVHFNAICDRFAPCETTVEITDGKDLSDAKLSNACSLHTASTSTSSSNSSLRRRRLGEIAEEEEDGEQRGAKRQSTIEEKDQPDEIGDDPARPRSPITGPPVTLDSNLATSPKESKFADTEEPPSFTGVPRPASPAKSFDHDVSRRMSTQSSRQDYYSSSSYLHYKPRVRLGPRPLADPAVRPWSSAGNAIRPVASMPAGLKLSLKGAKKSKTQDDSSSVISEEPEPSENGFLAPALTIPDHSALRPHTSDGRPLTSSGISVKSLPATTKPVKSSMTPEKLRLMKALQLREKKKRASVAPDSTVPEVQITPSSAPEADAEDSKPTAEIPETQDAMQQPTDNENEPVADQLSLSKADSAIDVASTAPTDHASEHTQTDSPPPSPICASSEVGDSTKASSVSESTDETLQPPGEKMEQEEKELGDLETKQHVEEQIVGVSTSSAEFNDDAITKSQNVSQAPLTQACQQPDAASTEADEEQAKCVQMVAPSESSFIPTSKFAAKLPSGQAAMDPMESRGQDPLNVTPGPGRIDEAGPVSVDTSERTGDDSAASSSKWNLPISKYSTHDSSKYLAPSPIPAIVTASADSSNGQDNIADAADKMRDESSAGEKRRSGRPESIQTDPNLPEKEAPQDDGKVTDEPQSATNDDFNSTPLVSPVTATPPQPSEPPTPRMLRTVSSPIHSPHSVAGDAPPSATRSISSGSALQQRMTQLQSSSHLAPRAPGKLSGGISSRIKAFEQLATKNPPPVVAIPAVTGSRPSSAFFSVRQNSVRDGARSPSVLERANSIYRGRTPTPAESLDSSPEAVIKPSRERSGSVASRLSVFEGGSAPRGKPETVQVTARIVREPGQNYPRAPESNVDPTEYTSLDLKQSPLIIDHRKGAETAEPAPAFDAPPVPTPLVHAGEARRSLQERRMSKDLKAFSNEDSRDSLHRPGQRTSLTMARDFIRDSMVGKDSSSQSRPPSVHQSGSLLSRLSINTRRKSISQESTLLSPTSVTDKSESGDETKPKEGNRASRLMQRLSSTFSPGRKQSTTLTSPSLPEENGDGEKTPPARSMTAPATAGISAMVAYMGDVNVQFPENLLWKRRTLSLDSNGFLHLSPAQGAISSREKQLKRFHMSEFKPPYAPEIEFQELPNSVCLDFTSGSGLQIAFTDRAGQLYGLQGEFTSQVEMKATYADGI